MSEKANGLTEAELRELAERGAAELEGASATDLLHWTDEHFGGVRGPRPSATCNYVVASNMQDAVLVDLAAKVRPGVPVLFLDTGYHFVETIGTRDAVEAVYDIRVLNVTPEHTVAEQDQTTGQGPVRPPTQRVLPATQGRPAVQGAARLLRVGDRPAPCRGTDSGQRPAGQLRRSVPPGQDQPAGRVDRRGYADLHRRKRCLGQPACLRRLSVDWLRPVHREGGRGRRSAQRTLAGAVEDRMRVARVVTTLVLVAHGSADPRSAANARAVANQIRFMRPGLRVRVAFCELNTPRLADVLTPGAVVTPLLLADAYHARIDIPRQIASCGVAVRQADVLGEDDRLVSVLHARLAELGVSPLDPELGVVVAAIGSTHAVANARTARVARKADGRESMGRRDDGVRHRFRAVAGRGRRPAAPPRRTPRGDRAVVPGTRAPDRSSC